MHDVPKAILKSLVCVAWADGQIRDEEWGMIKGLLQTFRANGDEVDEIHAYSKERKTLDDIPVDQLGDGDRRALLQYAVQLSFVDHVQAETEKQYIESLYKKLEIPASEARQLIAEAEDGAKRFFNL